MIKKGTDKQQLEGVVSVRKLLSIEKDPPIQEVIDTGLVNFLVQFIDASSFHVMQFEGKTI